jgi:ERCC4-type nuclease
MPRVAKVCNWELRIDAREHRIIDVYKRAYPDGDPNIDWSKNLALGDIQILIDGVTVVVAERKEANDFRSSVAGPGQRYRKQRAAMILARKKQPSLLLMYIFEGSVFDLHYNEGTKITPAHLKQLQTELSIKYGILTHYFNDYTDTVRFLCEMIECYKKNGSPASVLDAVKDLDLEGFGRKKLAAEVEEEGDVEDTTSPRYSPQAFFRISLENIYGMTPTKAQLVMEHFHNFPNMINVYNRIPREERRFSLLAKLKAPGDSRRFGPQLSKRIYACVVGLEEMQFRKPVVALDVDADEVN